MRPAGETPVRQTIPLRAVPWMTSRTSSAAPVASTMMSTSPTESDVAGVVRGAEAAHELGLEAVRGPIEHVHVVAALDGEQRRQQPDRPRAGHEHAPRVEARAAADALDLLPCLRDDAGRLDQHADVLEPGIEPHGELGLDTPALRAVAVQRLDPALGVAAVAAEIPLAARTAGARDGVGTAHEPDDEVAGGEPAALRALAHAPERLVAEHEPLLALRRPRVLAADDLGVGPADAEREPVDEHRAGGGGGLGHVVQPGRAGPAGDHRDRAHAQIIAAGGERPATGVGSAPTPARSAGSPSACPDLRPCGRAHPPHGRAPRVTPRPRRPRRRRCSRP